MTKPKIQVVYVTSSDFKRQEVEVLATKGSLDDGTPVSDLFEFEIRKVPIKEILEVNLAAMVMEEVTKAYSQLKVPCIVEHAGLVFKDRAPYPGGLTKPMWNALGDSFVKETSSERRETIAQAVVAYCDGMSVRTFEGETDGILAGSPRGHRKFYWDTVFIPAGGTGRAAGKTYAEIVEDPSLGLAYKVLELSQSTKAMKKFLDFRRVHAPMLWSGA